MSALIAALLLLAAASAGQGGGRIDDRTLRVNVLTRFELQRLTLPAGRLIASGPAGPALTLDCPAELRVEQGRVALQRDGRALLAGDWIELAAAGRGDGVSVALPDAQRREYPGRLLISVERERLAVVNLVSVADYLAGVVTAERGGPALPGLDRLLAVLARSQVAADPRYAAGRDISDLTSFQVYAGRGDAAAAAAVLATRDLVPVFDGKPVAIPFSACCGGNTAEASEVWPGERRPYLCGVSDLDQQGRAWCREHPKFSWTAVLTRVQLLQALVDLFPDLADCHEADVAVDNGRICAPDGSIRHCAGPDALRMALGRRLGWNRVLSNDFDVRQIEDGRIELNGRGFGHRVGVCQAGARARIAAGQEPFAVLASYCPGVSVVSLAEINP